jgi:hypothetical protein
MTEAVGTARCRAHPIEPAEHSCARCGDFMCLLCGPLEPVALCARCLARTSLDWEDRGDQTAARAFLRSWFECVTHPSQVGARLLGSGHAASALVYSVICSILCLLPLALVLDALLFTYLAPEKIGYPSIPVLSLSVAIAGASIAVPTLLTLCFAIWAVLVRFVARRLGGRPSLEVLIRTASYGPSLVALPIAGVLLLPMALIQQGAMTSAHLVRHAGLSRVQAFGSCAVSWLAILAALVSTYLLVR